MARGAEEPADEEEGGANERNYCSVSSGYAAIHNRNETRYCGTFGSLGQPPANIGIMMRFAASWTIRLTHASVVDDMRKAIHQPKRIEIPRATSGDETLDQASAMHCFPLPRLHNSILVSRHTLRQNRFIVIRR